MHLSNATDIQLIAACCNHVEKSFVSLISFEGDYEYFDGLAVVLVLSFFEIWLEKNKLMTTNLKFL